MHNKECNNTISLKSVTPLKLVHEEILLIANTSIKGWADGGKPLNTKLNQKMHRQPKKVSLHNCIS